MLLDIYQEYKAGQNIRDTLPGEKGLPILGHSLDFLYKPIKTALKLEDQHGPIYWVSVLGMTAVAMTGPDANELVLLDRQKAFSNAKGWEFFIAKFFNRGLMLLDFEEHKFHRGIMQAAFKKEALVRYLDGMNSVIEHSLKQWPPRSKKNLKCSLI